MRWQDRVLGTAHRVDYWTTKVCQRPWKPVRRWLSSLGLAKELINLIFLSIPIWSMLFYVLLFTPSGQNRPLLETVIYAGLYLSIALAFAVLCLLIMWALMLIHKCLSLNPSEIGKHSYQREGYYAWAVTIEFIIFLPLLVFWVDWGMNFCVVWGIYFFFVIRPDADTYPPSKRCKRAAVLKGASLLERLRQRLAGVPSLNPG